MPPAPCHASVPLLSFSLRSLSLCCKPQLARALNPEAPPQLRMPEPYDPEQGFIVHLDYALGLPDRLQSGAETRKARLVYGLYEVSPPVRTIAGLA